MTEGAKRLRALIAGCGSIGRRHARNLASLGVRDFVLCDLDAGRLERARGELPEGCAAVLFTDLVEAAAEGADFAFVCTPSSLHVPMAVELAGRGMDLFIEKPLSHSLDGVDGLRRVVEEKGLKAVMGMCYRFHPVLLRIKEILESGVLGRIHHVNYFGGHYLPDWHPGEDYRREYAARRELGGGVVLTSIHGIDNIRWLFGEVEECCAVTDKVSDLEMDVEDLVMALMRVEGGVYVSWQSDFLQRTARHVLVVTGSEGTLRCDIGAGLILTGVAGAGGWREEKVEFHVNSMYIEEARSFLRCVESRGEPAVDLADGEKTLAAALRLKETSPW